MCQIQVSYDNYSTVAVAVALLVDVAVSICTLRAWMLRFGKSDSFAFLCEPAGLYTVKLYFDIETLYSLFWTELAEGYLARRQKVGKEASPAV